MVSMPTGQTDRRTDADLYVMFSTRRGSVITTHIFDVVAQSIDCNCLSPYGSRVKARWTSTACGASIHCRGPSGTERRRSTASRSGRGRRLRTATGATSTRRSTKSARWRRRPVSRWYRSATGSRTGASETARHKPTDSKSTPKGLLLDTSPEYWGWIRAHNERWGVSPTRWGEIHPKKN